MTLEARNMELATQVINLRQEVKGEKAQHVTVTKELARLKALVDEQRREIDLLSSERTARLAAERKLELATNAENKALREALSNREKLNQSEKERKELKALNPLKLKKSLAETKKKHATLQAVYSELLKSNNALKTEHSSLSSKFQRYEEELEKLKDSMIFIMAEDDNIYASEDGNWGLKVSKYKYPDELESEKTPLRLRLTKFETGEMWVAKAGGQEDSVEFVGAEDLCVPQDMKDQTLRELRSIDETGSITAPVHVSRHKFL